MRTLNLFYYFIIFSATTTTITITWQDYYILLLIFFHQKANLSLINQYIQAIDNKLFICIHAAILQLGIQCHTRYQSFLFFTELFRLIFVTRSPKNTLKTTSDIKLEKEDMQIYNNKLSFSSHRDHYNNYKNGFRLSAELLKKGFYWDPHSSIPCSFYNIPTDFQSTSPSILKTYAIAFFIIVISFVREYL